MFPVSYVLCVCTCVGAYCIYQTKRWDCFSCVGVWKWSVTLIMDEAIGQYGEYNIKYNRTSVCVILKILVLLGLLSADHCLCSVFVCVVGFFSFVKYCVMFVTHPHTHTHIHSVQKLMPFLCIMQFFDLLEIKMFLDILRLDNICRKWN